MTASEEIKDKLDLVETIREYVPVKPAGINFQALCPFHGEKTPSFIISPEKKIWHCFGCGKGGDIFTFLMEMEGLSFKEALRQLAPKAGVVLKNEAPQDYSQRNRSLDIMALAVKYYEHILTTPNGAAMQKYLNERGLTEALIKDWHLGYAPAGWDNLSKFLVTRPQSGKKYTPKELIEVGLSVGKDGSTQRIYDRFRDRLMFPLNDVNGNPVGFSGRINPSSAEKDKTGKYINSPQTSIYDKSRILFGLDKAKKAIKEQDLAIIVEGQMDAITCHQFGFNNAVAASGTALTTEQVTLLKRYTKNIALCFDADSAGQGAADRGVREALEQEMNIKVIVVPNGKDPDESLRTDKDAFALAVSEAQPVMEYYFTELSRDLNLDEPRDRNQVIEKILPILNLMANKIEASYWLRRFAERLGVAEMELRDKLSSLGAKTPNKTPRQSVEPSAPASRENQLSERLLAIVIKFPQLLDYSTSRLDVQWLEPEKLGSFYNNLIIYYNKEANFVYSEFKHSFADDSDEAHLLDRLVLLGDKDFYATEELKVREELIHILSELQNSYLQKRLAKTTRAMAVAEEAGDEEKIAALMEELKYLNDQRRNNQLLN